MLAHAIAKLFTDFVICGMTLTNILADVNLAQLPRDLDVLEVFTVAKSVASAAEESGYRSDVFDYLNEDQHDVTGPKGFQQALALIMRVREGGLLVLAPECKTFSFACMAVTGRNRFCYGGDTTKPFVQKGNALARTAWMFFLVGVARGLHVCLENPSGSMLFSFLQSYVNRLSDGLQSLWPLTPRPTDLQSSSAVDPQLQAAFLADRPDMKVFYVDRCAYEDKRPTFKKKYKFLCSSQWFSAAVRTCSCSNGFHEKLMTEVVREDGTVSKTGTSHLTSSGFYPKALGLAIVQAWKQHCEAPPAARQTRLLPFDRDPKQMMLQTLGEILKTLGPLLLGQAEKPSKRSIGSVLQVLGSKF
ncbi:unnamed protein product [Symbiodinium natans]|uniref:Uncharacterized protein n=1 Tax=Symbiodinium natans TaxID=878477 RepID=A0A812RFY9_9DINO|nr:unnamed protein product [Symbiodinium natans]